MTDNNIKVFKNDSAKKRVDLSGVESINNIQIVRESESEADSDSGSDESELSELSEYIKKPSKSSKHSKKHSSAKPQSRRPVMSDYSSFTNPKKISKYSDDSGDDESEYSSIDSDSVYSEEPEKEKISFEEKQKLKQDILIKIQKLENNNGG